ncbi:hypothetical protein BC332_10125 [Capsicum chinense]|nr:hypothetical protein BC332_10125 [Capsicum chinense]
MNSSFLYVNDYFKYKRCLPEPSGVFLVAIRILGQRYLPPFPIEKYLTWSLFSISLWNLARRIKEFYRWPGDIRELLMYLKHAMDSKDSDLNSSSTQSEGIEDEMKAAAQDIASYQVVLSRDGKIVEFQRTNRGAENQRAASP